MKKSSSNKNMPNALLGDKIVIGISSRALFDIEEDKAIFMNEGADVYNKYQIEHEDQILEPGVAFTLVEKLLKLNKYGKYIEIILLSKNSSDAGIRIFNSINHYGLDITRAAFTRGISTSEYAKAFGAHLFLSANATDVKNALHSGMAAATILPTKVTNNSSTQLRIAFDGDAVLFSDASDRVFYEEGIEAFWDSEAAAAKEPLPGGPFKDFLAILHKLQTQLPQDENLIRTALITGRAAPSHERVLRTLRAWNIRIDELLFLGGLNKSEFLGAFNADIFFDDHRGHCEATSKCVATGHVPNGLLNEE